MTFSGALAKVKHASKRLLWPARLAVTFLLLWLVILTTPWRDRVLLADGTSMILLGEKGHSLLVRDPHAPQHTRFVDTSLIDSIEPGVFSLLRNARIGSLGAYAACIVVISVMHIQRWFILLSHWTTELSPKWCAAIWARACALTVLPFGQLGGDAYRATAAGYSSAGMSAAISTVIVERLAGLIGLLFVLVLGLGLSRVAADSNSTGVWLGLGLMGLVISLPWWWKLRPVRATEACSRTTSRTRLGVVLDFVKTYWTARFFTVMILSFLIQLLHAVSFACVDNSLNIFTPTWCYLVLIPMLTLIEFLPIHVAGLGVREACMLVILVPISGATEAEVIAVSAAARLLGLLWVAIMSLAFLLPTASLGPSLPVNGIESIQS